MPLIIAANREPIQRQEDGSWQPSVGGLTSALLPVLEERGGAWVAWGEDDIEQQSVLHYPPGDPKFHVSRLELSEDEVQNYYYGFSNRVLWPLRSEEHTSELQSRGHLVCRLPRENKNST